MTFLELVQHVVRYAGIADSGPSTVEGQVGDYLKAVTYVQDAHAEIQNRHFDWAFLWDTGSLTTTAGTEAYPGDDGLHLWDEARIHLDGDPLPVIDWYDYEPEDLSDARPHMAVIRPDNQLQLVPAPDKAYTLTYDWFRAPKVLSGNLDTPLIPEAYRMVIVGRALMLYGNYEAAVEAKTQGAELYQSFMDQLEAHQLPRRRQTYGRQESAPFDVEIP